MGTIENATVKAMQGGVTAAENTTSSREPTTLFYPPGTYEIVASAENYTPSSSYSDVNEPSRLTLNLHTPTPSTVNIHDPPAPLRTSSLVRDQLDVTIAENYTDSAGRYMVNYGEFEEHPGVIRPTCLRPSAEPLHRGGTTSSWTVVNHHALILNGVPHSIRGTVRGQETCHQASL